MVENGNNLEQTVSEHALQISIISNTLTDMKDSMKDIAKAMRSQELLLEKLSNIEASHESSKERMYKIIDNQNTRIDKLEKIVDSTCPIVDNDISNLDRRVGIIEKAGGWAIKLVIGFVILALLGLVITKG